jgi:hypothetical protein
LPYRPRDRRTEIVPYRTSRQIEAQPASAAIGDARLVRVADGKNAIPAIRSSLRGALSL